MACKYCGKSTETGVIICTECNSILTESPTVKTKKPLYLLLFVGILLPSIVSSIYTVVSYFRYIDLIPDYGKHILFTTLITLPSNSYIWFAILVVLLITKKINPYCCEREDAILWIGMKWVGAFLPINMLAQSVITRKGTNCLEGNSIFVNVRNVFEMPGMWLYICLIIFLLIRSEKIKFQKKQMVVFFCILLIWSLLIVLFKDIILEQLFEVSAEDFSISHNMWQFSAMFMWLRYLILMWFAVSWAKKQIGFVCVTLCIMCFSVLPGMLQVAFITCEAPLALWTDSNIAYIIAGFILAISKFVNKRSAT